MANLACLELHPHPVRAEDLDHPDELRVDLDPVPGIEWSQTARGRARRATRRSTTLVSIGWPKTSGSRGIHVNVRLEPRWTFQEVRRAAVALAREKSSGVRRRLPPASGGKKSATASSSITTRTRRTAPWPRPIRCARTRMRACRRHSPGTRSTPAIQPTSLSTTMPSAVQARLAIGIADIDEHPGSLDALLELAARHKKEGLGDAPWPPQYQKQPGRADARAAITREEGHGCARRVRRRAGCRQVPAHRDRAGQPSRRRPGRSGAWKEQHPEVVAHLEPADILVDAMRGRSSTWTRVRVNLKNVPEALRPSLLETPARARKRW